MIILKGEDRRFDITDSKITPKHRGKIMNPFRFYSCCLAVIAGSIVPSVRAYDGSDAFLHYYAVPEAMKAEYSSVCKSLVLSDAASDTLKNAKAEFDIAIPKLLGGSALPVADGEGAIVLAEQGSAPVASAGLDYSTVTDEGFIIKSGGGKTYISGKTQVGVLRGAFHFLRLMQTSKSIGSLTIVENPYFSFRVLDHWYNHYGSGTEGDRLYGGNRVFKMENFGNLQGEMSRRIEPEKRESFCGYHRYLRSQILFVGFVREPAAGDA
jgi:alpha-glucuronidase